jgi:hypothetical protein
MTHSESTDWPSISMVRIAGYCFLLFALFDFTATLIPFRLNPPDVLFDTIGAITERVPIAVLGIILVFWGTTSLRQSWEPPLLRFLSWATLVAGALFFLLVPVLITLAFQLQVQIDGQVNTRTQQQIDELQRIEQTVSQASPTDLDRFLKNLKEQENSTQFQNSQALRSEILAEVGRSQKEVKSQSDATRAEQRTLLLRDTAKWSIGALISGFLYSFFWRSSTWARRFRRAQPKVSQISVMRAER